MDPPPGHKPGPLPQSQKMQVRKQANKSHFCAGKS